MRLGLAGVLILAAAASWAPTWAGYKFVVAPGGGCPCQVKRFEFGSTEPDPTLPPFDPYPEGTPIGLRVALADVDGDHVPDIVVGPGSNLAPLIRVFSGVDGSLLSSFLLPVPGFLGAVNVAAADVDLDGKAEVIAGIDAGGAPWVYVCKAATGEVLGAFLAYDPVFSGGVRVAAADVDGDGVADIITGSGPGVAANVRVYSGASGALLRSFLPMGPSFFGGVYVTGADFTCDGRSEIVVGAGAGAAPLVSIFDGQSGALLNQYLAFSPSFTGGVQVAAGRMDGDGAPDVLTVPASGSPMMVTIFQGLSSLTILSFFASDPMSTSGGTLAAAFTTCPFGGSLPRPVPDGRFVQGTPMKAHKADLDVELTWDTATCSSSDYNLYYGALGDFSAFTGGQCGLGVTGSAIFTPPDEDIWWVVAGSTGSFVSRFGQDSRGRDEAFTGWGSGGVCPGQSQQYPGSTCP